MLSSFGRPLAALFVPLLVAALSGCGQPSGGKEAAAKSPAEATPAGAAANGELGNLVEPFTPPTLAELDAKAEWIDQPVQDGMQLLRKLQAEDPPSASPQQALALKNDSPEANEKILSALGRLPTSDRDVDWDATINRHLPIDLKSTNPIMVSSVAEFEAGDLMTFNLFSFDWTLRTFASADVVVSWQTSKDRLYDKVVMRDDLTWSDGKPITAHDVVFTYRAIMDSRVPVPAVRSGTDKLRWVEAYDDHTLVFFHKESLATNVHDMVFPVIPRHIYEQSIRQDYTLQSSPTHVQYENHPISGGPYTMTSRRRGQEIVFERRESWYLHNGKQVREKAYYKTVRFRVIEDTNTSLLALKTGKIDESMLMPEQWLTQTSSDEFYERNTKASGIEWVYFYFGWNSQTPFFSDVRVRQAMSYAVDYDELLGTLCYGLYQPCSGIFYPTAWMAPKPAPPPYHQDLHRAEQLLDEAGWQDHDGDGIRDKEIDGRLVPFKFSILCPNLPERVAFCNLLKESLDQIGVICNVRPMEFTVLQEKTQQHQYQAMFGGWGTGTDPDSLENIWGTGAQRNFLNYSNPEVDRLFVEGRKEFDRDQRAAIYARIASIIYADQPCTFLFFRNAFYGFNKQLRGYKFSPRGPYSYSPGFSSIWSVAE